MTDRKKIPTETESRILIESARRCCVCFGLRGDFTEKFGQIAHLDHDHSNSDYDNLAFMCLDHHNIYDSITSVAKGMNIEEVKHYRTILYEEVSKELPRQNKKPHSLPETDRQQSSDTEIPQLLVKVQSCSIVLSQCIAEALTLAQKTKNTSLQTFCKDELSGYVDADNRVPSYRRIEGFATYKSRISPNYIGWGDNTDAVLDYMRTDEDFQAVTLRIAHSVSHIESLLPTSGMGLLGTITKKASEFDPATNAPDYPVIVYTRPDVYARIYEQIRQDLVRRLVALLP